MSGEEGPKPSVTVTVVAGGATPVRTIRIPYPVPGRVGIFGGLLTLALLILSWGYFAVRASRVAGLEEEIAEFQGQEERIEALAQSLVEVELAYARIRSLFGADALPAAEDLWLPPAIGRTSRAQQPAEPDLPTAWPLTQGGYVTQDQLPSTRGGHPGIDIATPSGSYIRASASGVVAEAGEDEVYGYFLVLDHGTGYRTRYAHASMLLVAEGARVRRNEVIALSGSTGQSTAPHLHFEILQEGTPVDPLSLVVWP